MSSALLWPSTPNCSCSGEWTQLCLCVCFRVIRKNTALRVSGFSCVWTNTHTHTHAPQFDISRLFPVRLLFWNFSCFYSVFISCLGLLVFKVLYFNFFSFRHKLAETLSKNKWIKHFYFSINRKQKSFAAGFSGLGFSGFYFLDSVLVWSFWVFWRFEQSFLQLQTFPEFKTDTNI